MRKRAFLFFAVAVCLALTGAAVADHELGPPPSVEAEESAGKAKIVLQPECPVGNIAYRTEDDSARAGQDYGHVEGTLNSTPWEFEVPILEDTADEETETVLIRFSGVGVASGPGFGGNCAASLNQSKVGRLFIHDNDGAASLAGGSTRTTRKSSPTPRRQAAPAVIQSSVPDESVLTTEETTSVPAQKGVTDQSQPALSRRASILTGLSLLLLGGLGIRRFRLSTPGSNQQPDTVVSETDEGETR